MLHEHALALGDYLTSDPKGKQIPTYLVALGDHLTQERASVLKELSSLGSKTEHIGQIISMQQDFTRVGGLEASENLAGLMDEALAINFASLERHHIEVIREYAEIPLIVLDRHPVLQILVNLISNAKYAMPELPDRPHRLTAEATIMMLTAGIAATRRVAGSWGLLPTSPSLSNRRSCWTPS